VDQNLTWNSRPDDVKTSGHTTRIGGELQVKSWLCAHDDMRVLDAVKLSQLGTFCSTAIFDLERWLFFRI